MTADQHGHECRDAQDASLERLYQYLDGALTPEDIEQVRAHVTTRNFPDSVADFRRRTGIREGGEVYLFATTDLRGRPVVLVCEKLTPSIVAA